MKYTQKRKLASAIAQAKEILKSHNNWEDQERDDSGRFGSGEGGGVEHNSGRGAKPKDPRAGRSGTSAKPGDPKKIIGEVDSILDAIEGGDNLDAIHDYDLDSIREQLEAARNEDLTPEEREELDRAFDDFNALGQQLEADGVLEEGSFPFAESGNSSVDFDQGAWESLTHEYNMPQDIATEYFNENPDATLDDAVEHFLDMGVLSQEEVDFARENGTSNLGSESPTGSANHEAEGIDSTSRETSSDTSSGPKPQYDTDAIARHTIDFNDDNTRQAMYTIASSTYDDYVRDNPDTLLDEHDIQLAMEQLQMVYDGERNVHPDDVADMVRNTLESYEDSMRESQQYEQAERDREELARQVARRNKPNAKAVDMPKPKDFDDEEEFISACISTRHEENPDEDPDQAVAICMSMWEDHKEPSKQLSSHMARTKAILGAKKLLRKGPK